MHVARAVVDALARRGIDTAFGIPGKQTLPLNEAIDEREDVRFVMARHETAVTHQAWGYAETSGRPAATVVVPGPGDLNASNGLKNALNDCTPLVHLAVETEPELRGGDGIHETPPETYDTLVKENVLVERPQGTIAALDRAIDVALTPPTGPVRVGIPKNFLDRDVALASPPSRPSDEIGSVAGATDGSTDVGGADRAEDVAARDVEAAADLLADAEEPIVVAGGGVRWADASAELEAVARRLDAPIATTYKGKGVCPEDHPLSAGALSGSAPPALLERLADADAALAVGTDFDAVATRAWSVELPEALVHVTLDPDDLGTGYEPTVSVLADAAVALSALDDALDARGVEPPAGEGASPGARRARAVRADFAERVDELRVEDAPLTSVAALEAVREAVPREATVAVDAGGFRVWALNAFPAYGPRSYVNPGSWASMGTGLPSGIGAQLADPDADVVVLTGDGGLMMCCHELHTAVAEELPITVVAFANDDYAIISEEGERRYALEPNAYGWLDAPIDFVALAESLGMRGERATDAGAVEARVAAAVSADEPVLVEVPTDPREPQASEWLADGS